MRTDDALRQTLDGKVLEANFSIRLVSGMHDDQVSWMAGRTKDFLYALVERLGDAHQREAVDRDRGAVRDRGDGFGDGGDSHPPP